MKKIPIKTHGERFYDITDQVQNAIAKTGKSTGMALLFCPHTSCALAISEAYDPSAREDIEKFFRHLAPENLAFIKHKDEGPDDSPSHMKSVLLHQSLTLLLEDGQVALGRWQGIYLAEFRALPHNREIWLECYGDVAK